MSLNDLTEKITRREAKLAVIGLGYVGLPVAALFAKAGFDVLGVEIKQERVDKINAGLSPIEGEEPGLAQLLAEQVTHGRLRAAADYETLRERDVILIDVETPVDDQHIPRYEALRAALTQLAPVLKRGALVIVESTIAPRTMDTVVRPLLEEGSGMRVNRDFYLGNCPERVMPGRLLTNLSSLSRVVGGGTPETAQAMIALYRLIVQADLDAADWITAELVKTVENAYRDVQIAFANEVGLICEALGGDVWTVRELVNKSPQRHMHLPGAGVGGHCIPKDPWLLAHGIQGMDVPLRMVPTARAINDGMPAHMVDLLSKALAQAGVSLAGARVLVLGYAYLENSDDTRNSPSAVLVRLLESLGADVRIHDPYVEGMQGDVVEAAQGADAVVLMVRHQAYNALDLPRLRAAMRTPVLVDGRKAVDGRQARELGFLYWVVGAASPAAAS
mgnify:FL=1